MRIEGKIKTVRQGAPYGNSYADSGYPLIPGVVAGT
jgi:hypothetical protein